MAAPGANAAAAVAAAVNPLQEVMDVLAVVGLTVPQANRFVALNAITSFRSFNIINPDMCATFMKSHNGIVTPAANKLGFPQQQGFQGFLHWYHCLKNQILPIRAADFTADVMATSLEDYNSLKAVHESGPTDITLTKIETEFNYQSWKKKTKSLLYTAKGSGQYPLGSVIRPAKPAGWTLQQATSDIEKRVYTAPLTGAAFTRDNEKVFNLLYQACIDNPMAAPWLQPYAATMNGKGAWENILANCEGQGANDRRIIVANRAISTNWQEGGLNFTTEYGNFTFAKYASALSNSYQTMGDIRPPIPSVATQVTRLIDGIIVEGKLPIEMGKETARNMHLHDWNGAVQHLAAKVTIAFPPRSPGKRGRNIKETGSGRGGRGRGRGRGSYGRGGRGSYRGRGRGGGRHSHQGRGGQGGKSSNGDSFNGVNLSDPHRYMSNDEMNKLGYEGRVYMFSLRGDKSEYERDAKKVAISGNNEKPKDVNSSDKARSGKGGHAGNNFGKGAHDRD